MMGNEHLGMLDAVGNLGESWAMNPSLSGIWASMMDPLALEGFVVGEEPIGGLMYDNSWFGGDVM